jgi:hypothetical protein
VARRALATQKQLGPLCPSDRASPPDRAPRSHRGRGEPGPCGDDRDAAEPTLAGQLTHHVEEVLERRVLLAAFETHELVGLQTFQARSLLDSIFLHSVDCEQRRFKPLLNSPLARDHCELRLVAVEPNCDTGPAARSEGSLSYTRTREYQIPNRLATKTPQ